MDCARKSQKKNNINLYLNIPKNTPINIILKYALTKQLFNGLLLVLNNRHYLLLLSNVPRMVMVFSPKIVWLKIPIQYLTSHNKIAVSFSNPNV